MEAGIIAAAFAGAGFLLNSGIAIAGAVWAVGKIRTDTAEKIAAAKAEAKADIDKRFADLLAKFDDEQRTQDHNVGEMGSALRRHIETVHEKLREVEIWGRDNYTQKPEVESIRQDIKELARSIKEDFKDLNEKIDRTN